MSPLARSLLALVALIAAADAEVTELPALPGGRCAGFRMVFTDRLYLPFFKKLTFQFKASGDGQLHNIVDHCISERIGVMLSQTVKVCNEYHHPKLPMSYPPKVFALGDNTQSPVFAACDPWVEASHQCGLLTFHITQECSQVIAY